MSLRCEGPSPLLRGKAFRCKYRSINAQLRPGRIVALAIARGAPLTTALRFVDAIGSSSEIELLWVSRELHQRAMQLLFDRADKAWSLCDAVSFVVMGDQEITHALTTDRHFDQAGLVRLLDQ